MAYSPWLTKMIVDFAQIKFAISHSLAAPNSTRECEIAIIERAYLLLERCGAMPCAGLDRDSLIAEVPPEVWPVVEVCLDSNSEVFAAADRIVRASAMKAAELRAYISAAAGIELLARSEIGSHFGELASRGNDFSMIVAYWREAVHLYDSCFRLSGSLLPFAAHVSASDWRLADERVMAKSFTVACGLRQLRATPKQRALETAEIERCLRHFHQQATQDFSVTPPHG